MQEHERDNEQMEEDGFKRPYNVDVAKRGAPRDTAEKNEQLDDTI